MKKTGHRFQKTKNWKTKFRLVLLIPLIFIIIFITGTLNITGMTGKVTETLTTASDTIAEDTNSFTVFNKEKTYEDKNKEDSNNNTDDGGGTEDEPAEETNSIFSILSGSFSSSSSQDSSSNSQDDNKQTKTELEEDEKTDEVIDENICETMPETIIFIETETESDSPPIPQAEFWGTITIDNEMAEDWLDVKAETNGSIISQAKTCKGYYDIFIPDTGNNEIKIFIDEKYAGTFEWSSGIHNEDLII